MPGRTDLTNSRALGLSHFLFNHQFILIDLFGLPTALCKQEEEVGAPVPAMGRNGFRSWDSRPGDLAPRCPSPRFFATAPKAGRTRSLQPPERRCARFGESQLPLGPGPWAPGLGRVQPRWASPASSCFSFAPSPPVRLLTPKSSSPEKSKPGAPTRRVRATNTSVHLSAVPHVA